MSIDGIEEGHTGETPSCPQSAHLYRLHPLLFFLIIYTSCSLYLHAVTISSFGFLRLLRSSSSPTHSLDTHIALRSYSYGTFVVPNTSIVLDHICFLDINLKYTPQTIRTRPADSPYSSPPLLLSSLTPSLHCSLLSRRCRHCDRQHGRGPSPPARPLQPADPPAAPIQLYL